MDKVTQYQFCPNPQAIVFNTNWDIRIHPALQFAVENVEGVEPALPGMWAINKYDFLVCIGACFDREQVAKAVLQKINEYFSE